MRTTLQNWTDWDLAAFRLGRAIGLYERDEDFQHFKGDFWTDNPLGGHLHDALRDLVLAGVLEERESPDHQFRWAQR